MSFWSGRRLPHFEKSKRFAIIRSDTGALSLGATLGVIAMMTDSVIALLLIGFVFVIETLSVIIQQVENQFQSAHPHLNLSVKPILPAIVEVQLVGF